MQLKTTLLPVLALGLAIMVPTSHAGPMGGLGALKARSGGYIEHVGMRAGRAGVAMRRPSMGSSHARSIGRSSGSSSHGGGGLARSSSGHAVKHSAPASAAHASGAKGQSGAAMRGEAGGGSSGAAFYRFDAKSGQHVVGHGMSQDKHGHGATGQTSRDGGKGGHVTQGSHSTQGHAHQQHLRNEHFRRLDKFHVGSTGAAAIGGFGGGYIGGGYWAREIYDRDHVIEQVVQVPVIVPMPMPSVSEPLAAATAQTSPCDPKTDANCGPNPLK